MEITFPGWVLRRKNAVEDESIKLIEFPYPKLGNITGNPGVFQPYPDPNPPKPIPRARVRVFTGWGHGFDGFDGFDGFTGRSV